MWQIQEVSSSKHGQNDTAIGNITILTGDLPRCRQGYDNIVLSLHHSSVSNSKQQELLFPTSILRYDSSPSDTTSLNFKTTHDKFR
jgi:hypothetical protein